MPPLVRLPHRPSQTKIVATVGPACDEPAVLQRLVAAGVDVFRLNSAHGTLADHRARLQRIRRVSQDVGYPVAVLLDLAGPKIRLGQLPNDSYQCVTGETVRFVRGEYSRQPGELTSSYPTLIDELAPGDRVMMADGLVALQVEATDAQSATCRVVQGGLIRSRQGINLPGVKLQAPALQPSDREAAHWAAENGIDFVGLSFVRTPDDVIELRRLLGNSEPSPQIIAKIEKPEALDSLEAIVTQADGVMVARGDLGVEIDIARVAVEQKRILRVATRLRKPVIIATQMLDSMQHSRLPTRAEVADVANAVLDGADACMLSGETAIGQYPVEAVQMMHRIAMATEETPPPPAQRTAGHMPDLNEITEVTALHAGHIAEELSAKLIVVATSSGRTALCIAKHHFPVPTVGVSDSPETLRRMCLYWGIIPVPGAPTSDSTRLLNVIVDWGRNSDLLSEGDRVVLIAGTGLAVSAHNSVIIHQVS